MKAISLWQPWASAMFTFVNGQRLKANETRSWRTDYRGPLLIHAAKKCSPITRDFAMTERALGRLPARLPLGAIIGIVNLDAIKRTEEIVSEISAIERLYGDYSIGRWAWITNSCRAFETPIPYKGKQGIFEVPDELLINVKYAGRLGVHEAS